MPAADHRLVWGTRPSLLRVWALTAGLACGQDALPLDSSQQSEPVLPLDKSLVQAPLGRDKIFVIRAAAEETSAATLGQLGQRRSTSPRVRTYAACLATKHRAMRQELIDLAKRRGSFVPMTMSSGGERYRAELQRHPPSEFDRDYLAMEVQMQHEVVDELVRVSGLAKDAELRAWAATAATKWAGDEAGARGLQALMEAP
jgi:predicted outer membrane protein